MADLSLEHHFEIMKIRAEFRDKLQALAKQSHEVTWSAVEAAELSIHCGDPELPKWLAETSKGSLALTKRIIAEHEQAIKDSTF